MTKATLAQGARVLELLEKNNIGEGHIRWLINSGELLKRIMEFEVEVDPTLSPDKLTIVSEADTCGSGDLFIEGRIDEKAFPPCKSGEKKTVKIRIIPNEAEKIEDILNNMKGYRFATLWELHALGITYPWLQLDRNIIACGSCIDHGGAQASQYPVLESVYSDQNPSGNRRDLVLQTGIKKGQWLAVVEENIDGK